MAEIKYEIVETVAVLSEGNKGWKKELNLISWNGREPKYDIRDWSEDHTKMGKGVTLSLSELQLLKESLAKLSDLD
ncbi:PC4/YdbC family ssDNA-binding protein [Lysinibacillus sp. CTST325]|uniref:YdbC family protein n=1 Tax=unclassified Lysinibacillus TaxID=2636778 RepID=UPI0038182ECE